MSSREVTIAAYVAILFVAVTIDLAARTGAWVPSFGEVVTLVARSWVVRFALLALWWWLGWHFLARSSPAPV